MRPHVTLPRPIGSQRTGHPVAAPGRPRLKARIVHLDNSAETAIHLPEPIRTQTFDVIIAMHVIHHCINPVGAIGNLAGRLAPGGRLICEVPNQECLGARWAGVAWGPLDVPRQASVFTPQSPQLTDRTIRTPRRGGLLGPVLPPAPP
jgi:SAM-dependent methyltransferase